MTGLKQLIFDADDTLWENNFIYESTRSAYIKVCTEHNLSEKQILADFFRIENDVVLQKGYGSHNFLHILKVLYKMHLAPRAQKEFSRIIDVFLTQVNNPRPVFPNVIQTLEYLSGKYQLYVLTKGDLNEQRNKLEQSGLKKYFIESFIRSEKSVATYQEILTQKKWSEKEVCMIGNSPKSDINPALQCGIYAIYIPYVHTWRLEQEELLTRHPRLRQVGNFDQLRSIL